MIHNKMGHSNEKITDLEDRIASLEEQLCQLQSAQRTQVPEVSLISREQVEKYVASMLEKHNIKLIPDSIESAIYVNIFMLSLEYLQHILEKTNINLFNHTIHATINKM